jgi:hypothetical protein
LRVVARAEDGLPEAVELPVLPYVVGVQWHPEELATTDQHHSNLFYDFVEAAASDWQSQVPREWAAQFAMLQEDKRPYQPPPPLMTIEEGLVASYRR